MLDGDLTGSFVSQYGSLVVTLLDEHESPTLRESAVVDEVGVSVEAVLLPNAIGFLVRDLRTVAVIVEVTEAKSVDVHPLHGRVNDQTRPVRSGVLHPLAYLTRVNTRNVRERRITLRVSTEGVQPWRYLAVLVGRAVFTLVEELLPESLKPPSGRFYPRSIDRHLRTSLRRQLDDRTFSYAS
jgi:hypothetical protein